MLIYIIILTFGLNDCSWSLSTGEADEIHDLPGLSFKPTFRQYSGYLNASKGRYFHYWFVESQSKPKEDPVIVWLNGGPGCSSMGGFWIENGPFRVNSDGKTLIEDSYSWNTLGNVIYLESPAGAGYSYDENQVLNNSDDQTAKDNYLALQNFFEKFPQFKNNSFFITGESYAGVYIPMLALEILRDNSKINLKGLAIGNGLLDPQMLMNSRVRLAHTHGIIDNEMWNVLTETYCLCHNNIQECDFNIPNNKSLNVSEVLKNLIIESGINPYNIYDYCSNTDGNSTDKMFSNTPFYNDLSMYFNIDFDDMEGIDEYYSSRPECVGNGYVKYINAEEVRKALHIPSHVKTWIQCQNVNYKTQYKNMKLQFIELISKFKIEPFIVYNGDVDLVCDFLANQQFVDGLGLTLTEKYRKWTLNGKTAGFVKRFNGLTFMTVRNAGHKVPYDKPEAALKIIKELIGISSV